jgi:hypothetical protein
MQFSPTHPIKIIEQSAFKITVNTLLLGARK